MEGVTVRYPVQAAFPSSQFFTIFGSQARARVAIYRFERPDFPAEQHDGRDLSGSAHINEGAE